MQPSVLVLLRNLFVALVSFAEVAGCNFFFFFCGCINTHLLQHIRCGLTFPIRYEPFFFAALKVNSDCCFKMRAELLDICDHLVLPMRIPAMRGGSVGKRIPSSGIFAEISVSIFVCS